MAERPLFQCPICFTKYDPECLPEQCIKCHCDLKPYRDGDAPPEARSVATADPGDVPEAPILYAPAGGLDPYRNKYRGLRLAIGLCQFASGVSLVLAGVALVVGAGVLGSGSSGIGWAVLLMPPAALGSALGFFILQSVLGCFRDLSINAAAARDEQRRTADALMRLTMQLGTRHGSDG